MTVTKVSATGTTIVSMLRDGQIRPVVNDRLFPLDQTIDAIGYLASRLAKGRVILTV